MVDEFICLLKIGRGSRGSKKAKGASREKCATSLSDLLKFRSDKGYKTRQEQMKGAINDITES
jgi:hypothetical protein